MSGTFDLLVFIKGRTMHEAAQFVSEKLATMAGVTSTATHFMMKTYKLNGIEMQSGEDDERLQISMIELLERFGRFRDREFEIFLILLVRVKM